LELLLEFGRFGIVFGRHRASSVGDGLPLLFANRPVFADPRRNPEKWRAVAKRKQAKSNNGMFYEPTSLLSLPF
jgi:hypothetical protein